MRTDRGIRIKTRRGRGDTCIVDDICVSHVKMEQVKHCFVINMFYHCDPDGHSRYVQLKEPLPVGTETPVVRNIKGSAVFLYGLPESPIRNVTVEDCRFQFSNERILDCPDMMDDPVPSPVLGIYTKHVQGFAFENNQLESALHHPQQEECKP